MDNLIFEKIWEDIHALEFKIEAKNQYVIVWQTCYMDELGLKENINSLLQFIDSEQKHCYVEFGCKEDNSAPAFSMEASFADRSGHILLELDMEIDDNSERKHRCQLYIKTDITSLEQFCKRVLNHPHTASLHDT